MSTKPNAEMDELFDSVISHAGKTLTKMIGLDPIGCFKVVSAVMEGHDVVFGVFPDGKGGNGIHVIKGVNLLRDIIAANEPRPCSIGAVPCASLDQAIAAEQRWGDKTH